MKFAAKLRHYIEKTGIKKSKLAGEIGITPAMISRYLYDDVKPSYWTARKISDITDNYINMVDMGF